MYYQLEVQTFVECHLLRTYIYKMQLIHSNFVIVVFFCVVVCFGWFFLGGGVVFFLICLRPVLLCQMLPEKNLEIDQTH